MQRFSPLSELHEYSRIQPFRNYVRELSNSVAALLGVSTFKGIASVIPITVNRDPCGKVETRTEHR